MGVKKSQNYVDVIDESPEWRGIQFQEQLWQLQEEREEREDGSMQEETERDMHEEDNTKKFGDDYCVTFFWPVPKGHTKGYVITSEVRLRGCNNEFLWNNYTEKKCFIATGNVSMAI